MAADINLKEALQEYFGFDSFKGRQEEIIESLLSGRDVFVIMPTGGGKSLCYQLPGIISEGTAIVISPLIALMKNQVDMVRQYSSNDSIAHFLNSSLNKSEKTKVKEDLVAGNTKLLYVAPETLTKQENIDFFKEIEISFVAVDEAHCISEWGHDFRPEYRRIREMIESIDNEIPIIALTATATPKVKSDIVKTLDLKDPNIFISSFNRENLYYEIRPKRSDAIAQKNLVQLIKKHSGKSGIIYVINRKTAQKLAEILQINGISAAPYHAGIDNKIRSQTQDDFLMEEIDVIVATIAFGMGIDKPDIRFIVHYDIPKSIENYYQETGRAGRDELEGRCIAYFSYKDIGKLEKLMRDKSVAEKERGNQLINETVAYIETAECRRKFILHYFGEEYKVKNCGNCDNCLNPKERIDATQYLKTAIEAILELKENHDIKYIVAFLCGKKNKEITDFRHDQLSYFGKGSEKDELFWNSIIRQGMLNNIIRKDIEHYGLLKVTEKGSKFLQKPYKIEAAINHDYEEEGNDIVTASNSRAVLDPNLLKQLKSLRKAVATKHKLPPYVIFQDVSLEEMASHYPIKLEEFTNITGVSKGKAERYASEFSDLIKEYVDANGIDRPEDIVMKSLVKKSTNKVKIIKSIDQKISLDDIADELKISFEDFIVELETIVNSGTKVDIDYYLNDIMEPDLREEIYTYFKNADTDDLEKAMEEFEDEDELYMEDFQLIRIKFMSEMAN
ncbi:MAG: DNA helicase RecQ [Chitinophagales bacterium]|nr:DNA helicase RecQ [Chitinophagales bacterium]